MGFRNDDDERRKNQAVFDTGRRKAEEIQGENTKVVGRVNVSGASLHEMLGLDEDASVPALQKAWKKVRMQIHPDKNNSSGDSLKAFAALNNLYEKYIGSGLAYTDFLKHQKLSRLDETKPESRDKNKYKNVPQSPPPSKYSSKQEYYRQETATIPPSLERIVSDIEIHGRRSVQHEGGFHFGSFLTFTKIRTKAGEELPTSATFQKIHKVATDAIDSNRNVRETLIEILQILKDSQASKQSMTRSQKLLSFLHIRNRSLDTQMIHADLEKTVNKMLASDEAKPSRSRPSL